MEIIEIVEKGKLINSIILEKWIDFILTEKSVRLHLPFPEVMIQSIPSSQLTSKEILELFSTIFQYE